jgi:hypothetical protein
VQDQEHCHQPGQGKLHFGMSAVGVLVPAPAACPTSHARYFMMPQESAPVHVVECCCSTLLFIIGSWCLRNDAVATIQGTTVQEGATKTGATTPCYL